MTIEILQEVYRTYIEPNFPENERWDEYSFCDYISKHPEYHVTTSLDGNCNLVNCILPEKVNCFVYFSVLDKGKGFGTNFIRDYIKNEDPNWRYVIEANNEQQMHFWKKCGFYPLYCPGYVQPITMGGNNIPARLMAKGSFPDTYPLEKNLRKYVYGLNED